MEQKFDRQDLIAMIDTAQENIKRRMAEKEDAFYKKFEQELLNLPLMMKLCIWVNNPPKPSFVDFCNNAVKAPYSGTESYKQYLKSLKQQKGDLRKLREWVTALNHREAKALSVSDYVGVQCWEFNLLMKYNNN